eukprot:3936063-Pleurochrysis_carterae.AAC.1
MLSLARRKSLSPSCREVVAVATAFADSSQAVAEAEKRYLCARGAGELVTSGSDDFTLFLCALLNRLRASDAPATRANPLQMMLSLSQLIRVLFHGRSPLPTRSLPVANDRVKRSLVFIRRSSLSLFTLSNHCAPAAWLFVAECNQWAPSAGKKPIARLTGHVQLVGDAKTIRSVCARHLLSRNSVESARARAAMEGACFLGSV